MLPRDYSPNINEDGDLDCSPEGGSTHTGGVAVASDACERSHAELFCSEIVVRVSDGGDVRPRETDRQTRQTDRQRDRHKQVNTRILQKAWGGLPITDHG